MVIKGSLKVLKGDDEVSILESGDFFGEMSLLTGEPRSATVVAATDCKLVEISRTVFKVFIEKNKNVIDTVKEIFEERAKELSKLERKGSEVEKIKESLFHKFLKMFNG